MYNFLNFNEQIRIFLEEIYRKILNKYNTDDTIKKIAEIMNFINEENNTLYRIIIGLSFIDKYSILKDKENLDNLTETDIELLSIFNEINDIEDLETILNENTFLLNNILTASLSFERLNKKSKAKLILQLDEQYAYKFSKFSFLEKLDTFKCRTIDDIINIYKEYNVSIEERMVEIIEMLDIQLLGNIKNYEDLIITMLKNVYKWIKVKQLIHPITINEEQQIIIDIVESNSFEQILIMFSNNRNVLEFLIKYFLQYETSEIDKSLIDSIYESIVDIKVKVKLKEV